MLRYFGPVCKVTGRITEVPTEKQRSDLLPDFLMEQKIFAGIFFRLMTGLKIYAYIL